MNSQELRPLDPKVVLDLCDHVFEIIDQAKNSREDPNALTRLLERLRALEEHTAELSLQALASPGQVARQAGSATANTERLQQACKQCIFRRALAVK